VRVVVGSTALYQHGIITRQPNDLDVWVTSDEVLSEDMSCDSKVLPDYIFSLLETTEFDHQLSKVSELHPCIAATPDTIYTIKCSHLGWSNPMWEKHKRDVLYLKIAGCNIIEPLYEALVEYWKEKLGNKEFLSLDKSKVDFFTDHVDYKYDHDYLHTLVAHPHPPVYTRVLKDGCEVMIDRDKFFLLSHDDQVRMFKEEIATIALERWVLNPYWRGGVSWYKAHKLSVQKTITNLTKGWATDFLVRNLDEIYRPEFKYYKHALEVYDMSNKVDMSVFENAMEVLGIDDMKEMVFSMCEGDVNFCITNDQLKGWREDGATDHNHEVRQKLLDQIGYEHLEQEGGGKGGAEACHGVFKLGGKIYLAAYSYYSYDGCEYDDILDTLREVKRVEKTITVYE
jgi:hypothetical protein